MAASASVMVKVVVVLEYNRGAVERAVTTHSFSCPSGRENNTLKTPNISVRAGGAGNLDKI